MALRNGDFDWLGLYLINQVGYNPFSLAVPPTGATYDQSPAVTVSIPVAWIPYVIGALSVLEDESVWESSAYENAQEATKLISAIITGEEVAVPVSEIKIHLFGERTAQNTNLDSPSANTWLKRTLVSLNTVTNPLATLDNGEISLSEWGLWNFAGHVVFNTNGRARARLIDNTDTIAGYSLSLGGNANRQQFFVPFDFNLYVTNFSLPRRIRLEAFCNTSGDGTWGQPSNSLGMEQYSVIRVTYLNVK